MSSPIHSSLKYRAYIDGLRAIAVLAVLFYHADIGFSGGYVGVDVFFVISGFLITGLILKDVNLNRFQILEFWERRVIRILPALAVVVISCLIIGWFIYLPMDFNELAKSVLAQAMLISNVYFWHESGYFAQASAIKPLLHTWSLAVEEQFYLLFPMMLVAISRLSRKYLIPLILLVGCASFILSVSWSYTHAGANFYLLPTRAWELLIGAFLAAITFDRAFSPWLTESLSWVGVIAIMCAIFLYTDQTRFPGLSALLPCAGAALVIWSNGHTLTSVGKILSLRPVVFIGLISYSLYLWHWPILVFSKYLMLGEISTGLRLLLLSTSVIFATLSWKFVETPFRKRVFFKTRSQIFTFGILTTATMFLMGITVFTLKGVPSRIPTAALNYAKGENDRAFINELSLKQALAGKFYKIGKIDDNLPIGIFVWGDSHAMATMPIIDLLCKKYSVRGYAATHSATVTFVDYKSSSEYSLKDDSVAYNNSVLKFIRDNHVENVIIIARWDYYIDSDKGTELLRKGVLTTLNALKDTNSKIWIMRQVPKQHWDVPHALAFAVTSGKDSEALGLPLIEQREAQRIQDPIFEGLAKEFPNVTVLQPSDLFLNSKNIYIVAKNGKSLYSDNHHLSVAGSMVLRPLFVPIFDSIGKNPASIKVSKGIIH